MSTGVDPIELLRKKQGTRSQRELAREIGVSAAFLSDLYLGRRVPGPKVLDYLGLEKFVTCTIRYKNKGTSRC